MDQALKDADVKSKMLLQIHDELIFLVPDEELDLMQKLVKETMESAMELKVPLKASISVGKSWYEQNNAGSTRSTNRIKYVGSTN